MNAHAGIALNMKFQQGEQGSQKHKGLKANRPEHPFQNISLEFGDLGVKSLNFHLKHLNIIAGGDVHRSLPLGYGLGDSSCGFLSLFLAELRLVAQLANQRHRIESNCQHIPSLSTHNLPVLTANCESNENSLDFNQNRQRSAAAQPEGDTQCHTNAYEPLCLLKRTSAASSTCPPNTFSNGHVYTPSLWRTSLNICPNIKTSLDFGKGDGDFLQRLVLFVGLYANGGDNVVKGSDEVLRVSVVHYGLLGLGWTFPRRPPFAVSRRVEIPLAINQNRRMVVLVTCHQVMGIENLKYSGGQPPQIAVGGFFTSEIRFGGSGNGYNTRKGKKFLQSQSLVFKLPPLAGNEKSTVGVQPPTLELIMSDLFTHQNTALITISDLNHEVNHEPRVSHRKVAEALGFKNASDLLQLVDRNLDELLTYGVLPQNEEKPKGTLGGRPSRTAWLNESQAILLVCFCRTAKAAAVRKALIEVYQAYRNGNLVSHESDRVKVTGYTRGKDVTISARRYGGILSDFVAQFTKAAVFVRPDLPRLAVFDKAVTEILKTLLDLDRSGAPPSVIEEASIYAARHLANETLSPKFQHLPARELISPTCAAAVASEWRKAGLQ